jgi:ferredoxin
MQMPNKQHRVTFQPQGRAVSVLEGTTILEAAAIAGLVIDTPCGGTGTCGKCRVQVLQGAPESVDADRKVFAETELERGWRLACQNRGDGDMVIHVPTGSLFGGDHQIARDSSVGGPSNVRPAIRKIYVELAAPTLTDARPDLLRLEQKIGPSRMDVAINSASIALISDDLRRLPFLVKLSRAASRIVRQNLLFGVLYIVSLELLAALGYLPPVLAAILYSAASAIVVFNSARLIRFGESPMSSQCGDSLGSANPGPLDSTQADSEQSGAKHR